MGMPAQTPGSSKQDYGTPPELLRAVKKKLAIREFSIDLAATAENAVCPHYITPEQDAFTVAWTFQGIGWCNPPFERLAPWVRRAYEFRRVGQTCMLVPAGVGSNWWKEWVHDKARVLFLNGRLHFVGALDPYPKDCALLLYGFCPTYEIFTWREWL